MKYIYLSIMIFISFPLYSQNWEITPWYENKTAAISVTMDDQTSGQFTYALPEMNARSIRGTYFITTLNPPWVNLQTAALAGHEIAGHTIHHWDMTTLSDIQLEDELKGCHDDIIVNIPGIKYLSFAYPFGTGWGTSEDQKRVRDFTMKYYINARGVGGAGGNYGPFNYDRYYDFELSRYDNYYYQTGCYIMGPTISINDFTSSLDLSIMNGGWTILLYHGIQDGGYNEVSSAIFQQQMDSIVARSDEYWITTYGEVSIYHQERNSSIFAEKEVTDDTWAFELKDTLSLDSIFNHPLTIRLEMPDWMEIDSVTQGGSLIAHIDEDTLIQFNAIPDAGNVILYKLNSFTGCSDGSPDKPGKPVLSYNSDSSFILSWDKLDESDCISSYQVYMDGALIGSTINPVFYLPQLVENTTYSFYITATNSSSTISSNSDVLTVTVDFVPPTAPGALTQSGTTSSSLTVSWDPVDNGIGIYGYEVYSAAQLHGFTTDTFYTFSGIPASSSVYVYVIARDLSGNSSTPSPLFVGSTLAEGTSVLNSFLNSDEVIVFPNPSNNVFSIKVISENSKHYNIQVFTLSGKMMYEQTISSNSEFEFGESLSSGVYIVKIRNRNNTGIIKVFKY